jgi:maleylacetate reductase
MTDRPREVRGEGALRTLPETLQGLGSRRVLLLTGPKRRFLDRVEAPLRAAGFTVEVLATARVHVPRSVVDQALEVCRRLRADTVVSLGGGSATGLAKALRLTEQIRFVAIPSTYSGSEQTSIYGITDVASKQTGRDAAVRPDLIVYDPELTRRLPARLTAQSLLNALAHPIGALSTGSLDHDPALRGDAERAVRILVHALEQLAQAPDATAPRIEALEGAALAGRVLDQGTLGTHHGLAHFLGGRFDLDHAGLHSVLLPHTLAALRDEAPAAHARVLVASGRSDLPAVLFDRLAGAGAPTSLEALGVTHDGLSEAIEARPASAAVLRAAFQGRRP